MYKQFNVNDTVKVKLTDYGKECLRNDYNDLVRGLKDLVGEDYTPYEFRLPEEDKDGYSEWQLWVLMEKLGRHTGWGLADLPFETTILLSEEDLK